MAKIPRPTRRIAGKRNVVGKKLLAGRTVGKKSGELVRRRNRKYKLPKQQRFFNLDAEIGKCLMKELAGKSIFATAGVMSIEEIRPHSKKEIMARFNISEKRFDARAGRIKPLIQAYLDQKTAKALVEMGQGTKEMLELRGKLGKKRETQ